MTYEETIEFLYQRLPMFTRIGAAAYKKDLHNTIALLEQIGNPQHSFKTIHIAGTNGKGSTSHMLAAVLHANGYKTGLYTSPHLRHFGERIKVSGDQLLQMADEQFVINFVEQYNHLIDVIEPSFFELTVALAFEYFKVQQVDIAIIETGLGGRLDSTNVINPELSIITNIGWDHMNLLGDTLDKIAFEKAGIIKPDTPVVVGETLPETRPVFEQKVLLEKAPVYYAEDIAIESVTSNVEYLEIEFCIGGRPKHYKTDLPGLYQQYNLRSVITALEVLRKQGWQLDEQISESALGQVQRLTGLHGRWEVLQQHPYVIMDVGHNEDGIRQVLKQLDQMQGLVANVHWITGIVRDKEADKILALLPKQYQYYFSHAHIPRALPAEELQAKALQFGLNGRCYEHVNLALDEALAVTGKNDLVLICGSVFLAGEVDTARFVNKS